MSFNPPIFVSLLLLFLFLSPAVKSDIAVLQLPSEPEPEPEPVSFDSELCPNTAKPGSSSCPVKCFRPDPVCGEDGVTYWCGCSDALCAGTKVAKIGYCEVGNGGSGSLSGQALLLVHIVWLIILGFSVVCGLL